MPTNTNPSRRPALASASHSKSYDPSAPYRALLNPPPLPSSEIHPNSSAPMANIEPKGGVIRRIPQFYYPRYNEDDRVTPPPPPPLERRPAAPVNPEQTPVYIEDPQANPAYPYPQPIPVQMDPAAAGQYYPYGTPYLIPVTSNAPPVQPFLTPQEQAKNNAISEHQKDADLSRLEVYHFSPKSQSAVAPASQPIVQYHIYPQAPGQVPNPQLPPPMPYQQPQYPPYPYPWYANQPNPIQPPVPELFYPPTETKARASQTETPEKKNRGISPIQINPQYAPVYDDDGYPYIHHKTMPVDHHYLVPTGRVDRRFYDASRSTPLADCRCLDCQRERTKVLNYYPE